MPDNKDSLIATSNASPMADRSFDLGHTKTPDESGFDIQPLNIPTPVSTSGSNKGNDLTSSLQGLAGNIEKGTGGFHAQDYGLVSKADMPKGYDKYDTYIRGIDNEELAYQKQGTGERLLKSGANMINSFTKTVAEGITAPIVGVGYMLKDAPNKGLFNKEYYDNPYTKALEKWQGYDIAESKQRRSAAWYSPDYWMSANTLNSTLSTIGDLAGFAVLGEFAGATVGRVIGAAGRGIEGAIGAEKEFQTAMEGVREFKTPLPKINDELLGENYNRISQQLAEFTGRAPEGEQGVAAVKELNEGLGRINKSGMALTDAQAAQEKLISDISDKYIKKTEAFSKPYNKFQHATIGLVTNLAMAQSSALQASTNFRQKMVEEIEATGVAVSDEQMAKINEAAKNVGSHTGALMTVMGALTLHGAWNSILAKKEGEKFITNKIKDLVETEAIESPALGKIAQYEEADVLKKAAQKAPTSTFGKVTQPIRNIAKATPGFIKKNIAVAPAFGFLEFSAAPASVNSYYEKKYHTGDADFISDGLLPNIKNIFTKEGATNFMMGLVAGTVMEKVGGLRSGEDKEIKANTALAKKAMNDSYLRSAVKGMVDSGKRAVQIREDKLNAIANGDKEAEMTLRHEEVENYVFPRIKFGLKSFLDKDIQNEIRLASTDQGIRELQSLGLVPAEGNIADLRKDYIEHLNYIKDYANRSEKYNKALTLKYSGIIGANGKRMFSEEHIEKLTFLSGAIDDATKRIKDLSDDIKKSELSTDLKSIERFNSLMKMYEGMKSKQVVDIPDFGKMEFSMEKALGKFGLQETQDMFKRIDELSINKDQKDELAQKLGDFLKLNIRKKKYLNEYDDITTNPEEHKNFSQEDPMGAGIDAAEELMGAKDKIGETIDLVHGNSILVDGKKTPSKVELNTDYYIQNKPIEGIYNDKITNIRDFSKFKILGEKDGKLIISYESGGTNYVKEVNKNYFESKKIAKVSEVDKNVPAKFAMDHHNDLFIYSNPKVKLEGWDETLGDIFYDPTDKQLKFRYRGKDGKIKTRDIDIKDIEGTDPKLRFHDSVKVLTPEEKERIKNYKETEADRMQREKLIRGKLSIISDLILGKKERLKKVEDDLLDHEIRLDSSRKELEKVRTEIEKTEGPRKGLDNKRHIRTILDTANTLGRTIRDLEYTVNDLNKQSEDLREQITYLDDISITDLPNGKDLIKFLDENRKKIDDTILDTGIKINKITKFIQAVKDTLSDVIDNILNKISLFESKYLGGEPYSEKTAVQDYMNRQLKAKEYGFVDEEGRVRMGEGSDISKEFFDELAAMKKTVNDAEEFEIPTRESEIKTAEEKVSKLYDKLNDLGKELKLQTELYDAFNKAYKEFEKEQERKALFNSPVAKIKLYQEQKLANQRNNQSNGINTPEEWQKAAREKQSPLKSIRTVFMSGVLPSSEDRPAGGWPPSSPAAEHNNWADRYNDFTANSNTNFSNTVKQEGERYVTDDADYKKNMKVIVVSRNNQQHYFADSANFIKDKWEYGSKSVDNATDKRDASIAFIHTYIAEDGLHFVGKDGKLLSKVADGNANPNDVVFIRMETADLKRPSGKNKYFEDGLSADEILSLQKKAEEERGKILANSGTSGVYDYTESRGIENVQKDKDGNVIVQNNSVVKARLVPEDAIGKGVITIATVGDEDTLNGFVKAGDNAVSMPLGYPVLTYENNVAFLNGKKMEKKDVDHLYKVIQAMSEKYLKTGAIDPIFSKYLSSVLYFKEFYSKDKPSNNQIGFDNDGNLVMGSAMKKIKFHPSDIADNESLIKTFLENAHHNVSNKALTEKGFTEITGIDKNGEPITRTWDSYEHYLLSEKNPDGSTRSGILPLTTNIVKPVGDWEGPFKNKYVRPLFGEDYFEKIVPEKVAPKAEEVKPVEAEKAKVTEPVTEIKYGESADYTDAAGNKITYVPNELKGKTIVSISSIKNSKGEDIQLSEDEGIKKMLEIRDAITKPTEPVTKEVAPEVKETVKPAEPITEDPRALASDTKYNAEDDYKEFISGKVNYDDMDGTGDILMEVFPGDHITDIGNRAEEKAFMEAMLPQLKYEAIADFIKTGKGTLAYGKYKNHYITVYRNAGPGVGYHEAWHGVEDSFLSEKELNDIRDEFFNKDGTFIDRAGREISYSRPKDIEIKYDSKEKREYFEKDGKKIYVATEYDRREKMSEEFRQFKAKNPEFTKPSKATNFFKRLLNFIKHFVFGEPTKIEEIFKKINSGYYRDSKFVKQPYEFEQYSAMKDIPEATKMHILQGLSWKIIDNLRNSNGDLVKVGEGTTVYDLFEPVYNSLTEYYENKESKNSIWGRATRMIEAIKEQKLPPEVEKAQLENLKNETIGARQIWEYIKSNKKDVNSDLKDFFRKHKIIFTKNKRAIAEEMTEAEVAQQEKEVIVEYHDDFKDRGYDRDILKIDNKESAPTEIKLLFSFLTATRGKNPNATKTFDMEFTKPEQELTPLLLPQGVDSTKYLYQVLDEMVGITDPKSIKRRLAEMVIKDPVLYRFYAPIYKAAKTLNDWRLQISFNKFAAKIKPVYLTWRVDSDGKSYIMDSNLDTDSRLLVSQWESAMRNESSDLVITDKQSGVFQIDAKKIKNIPGNGDKEKSTIAFLKELNLPVDDKTINKLAKSDRAELITQATELYSLIQKGEQFKPINSKLIKATALGKIAKLLSKTGAVRNPSSHGNINGDQVQNHIMYNRLNRAMSAIVEAGTLDKLRKTNPKLFNDTWSKDGMFLKEGGPLFDEKGILRESVKNGDTFVMTVSEGLLNDLDTRNPRISTDKMNRAVRFMNMLNMNLGQRDTMIFFNFIPADSTTESGIRMEAYISKNEFKNGSYKTKLNKIMTDYLTSEIDLIKDNATEGKRIITENARKGNNYKKLQVFKDVLSSDPELVKMIEDHATKKYAEGEERINTEKFLKDADIKKRINIAVDNYFKEQVEKQMKFLEDYQILKDRGDETYKFYGINNEFTDAMNYGKDKIFTKAEIENILKYRDTNLFIHNTEMRKLFFGPWYEAPDAVKRDKLSISGSDKTFANEKDFNKWANLNLNKSGNASIQPNDFGYHTFTDTFNALTYDHDKGIMSRYYDEIMKVIGKDKAEPYTKVEESDAQGIVLDSHWREYILRSGDVWSDEYAKQHAYDMATARKAYYEKNKDKTYRSELKAADDEIIKLGDPMVYGVGTPKKPLGSGMLNNDSQNIPFSFKTSIMRLSYTVAKERGLEDLYWWMHDKNIGMVGPKSWQKLGRLYVDSLNGLPELYKIDKDGKPYIGLKDLTTEQLSQSTMNVNWSDFNKIVETVKSKKGKTMGSQLRSLAILNSFHYGLPVDFFNPEKDDFSEKMSEWNAFSPEEKKAKSDRYRMYSDNDKAIGEISKRGYENVLNTLGITEKNGEFSFTDPRKVVDYLRSEITRRDLPDNISAALTWKDDPSTGEETLAYPIEALPNYQVLKTIIWSLVDKNIIRPRLNGTDLILVSGSMWEKGIRETTLKNGKKILTSTELKFYEKGKDGAKTSMMQVYAPNIFREKLQAWKEKNPDTKMLSDEELLNYLNKTEDGKKLLTAVGFRIPTQGLNSVDAVEIVGFLHPSMGDSVVVPSEIVTKVGADFDVDKMGTYHYNFYVDKDGYPKLVKFIEDTNSEESLKKLYNARYSKKEREELSYGKLISDIFGKEEMDGEVPTFEEFVERYKGADPFLVNSREAIENKYYDTLQEIVTHPDNYEQLITPNSSKQMIDIEKEISDLQMSKEEKMKRSGRSKDDVNYANLTDPLYLSNERHTFIEAKGVLTGIGAQNNTFHALSQTQPIFIEDNGKMETKKKDYFMVPTGEKDQFGKDIMKADFNIYLPHKKLNVGGVMKTSYSGATDRVGNFISDKISQYINGAVDAVKDAWLMRLIKDKDLMGTAIFLDRIGVDPEHVFYFINQPIVQEYVKQQGIQKNIKGINPDLGDRYKDDIIANTMKMTYGIGDRYATEPISSEISFNDMREAIRLTGEEGKKMNELSAEQRNFQRQILKEYLKYEILGKDSLTEQMAIMWGNISGISDNVIKDKNASVDYANNISTIGAAEKILAATFQGQIKDSVNKAADAIGNILQVASSDSLKFIEEWLFNKKMFMKSDDRADVMDKATLSLIDFATQTRTKVAGTYMNQRIRELFLDENTNTAKKLANARKDSAIKGDLKQLLNDPNLLGKLMPMLGLSTRDIRNIKLDGKPSDSPEANSFTENLKLLRDNPSTNGLYRRLVLTGLIQSGVRDSRISFNKYIPHEDYLKELLPAIDAILSSDMSSFEDTMAFFRNHYGDSKIVPFVSKSSVGDIQYINYYEDNEILNNSLPDMLKAQKYGGLKAPKFLTVTKKADLQYPVLKANEVKINPETGKRYTSGEIDSMVKKGDYSWNLTRLFQKVTDSEGDPVAIGTDNYGNAKYIYKQINAWGDGINFQEYYDSKRPSALDKHEKVYELEDWQIQLAVKDQRLVMDDANRLKEEGVIPMEDTTTSTTPVVDKEKGVTVEPIDKAKTENNSLKEELRKGPCA